MASEPAITVLMPVYNGARYLPEALHSILGQSFTDFEFLIIDDGSSDESCAIVERCGDARIRLLRNGTNRGIAATLNRGIESARGTYLARMDSDDISRTDRLQKQHDFLEAHPEVGVCGTWIDCFGDLRARWRYPLEHQAIACRMLFWSAVGHATAMCRRQVLQEHGAYYAEDFPCAEDYELWSRLSVVTQFANLGEALYRYRRHPAQLVIRDRVRQAESASRVQRRLFERMGVDPTEEELRLHAGAVRGELAAADGSLERLDAWFEKILLGNRQRARYSDPLLQRDVLHFWWKACWFASKQADTWSAFRGSGIYRNARWQDRLLKSGLLGLKNLASVADRIRTGHPPSI